MPLQAHSLSAGTSVSVLHRVGVAAALYNMTDTDGDRVKRSLRDRRTDARYMGNESVKSAQQRAAEITAAAQSESRTLRQTVTDYCDNMLKTTEEAMVENAAQVKNVRANLRQNAKKNG